MENFRTPNFGLVADVLYWLVQRCAVGGAMRDRRARWRLTCSCVLLPCGRRRYDPLVNISDNIETEHDRVDFLVQISNVRTSPACCFGQALRPPLP